MQAKIRTNFRVVFCSLFIALVFSAQSWSVSNPPLSIDRLRTPLIVRNQGGTSLCWLHSDVQMMEQLAHSALSIDALLIPEIRSRALDRFLGYETPWDGGAGPTRPYALALEHGLVPDEIWKSKLSIVQNYHAIFAEIETLLTQFRHQHGVGTTPELTKLFLQSLDQVILKFTGTLPPTEFTWHQKSVTAVAYAREVIGAGASQGYDFRNVTFSEQLYGRMSEIPWTTIISREGTLKPITSVIKKVTDRVTAREAFEKATQIFLQQRPVAFTFITNDQDGRGTYSLNSEKEYIAVRPSAVEAYTGSHLVLIIGLIRKLGEVSGFLVLDPLASSGNGERIVTREFFETHGKTIHEVGIHDQSLSANRCNRVFTK